MRALRHPATLISIVALIVALTGSAYASSVISGKQIRNGTITGAKLANRTITGAKIANGTIVPANLSDIVRNGLNYFVPFNASGTIAAGSDSVVEALCPGGGYFVPVSGGYSAPSLTPSATVQVSELDEAGNGGWKVQIDNTGPSAIPVVVQVLCAEGP